MSLKVKLCGFKDQESLEAALKYNCDFIGFVFYKESCRNISINEAYKLSQIIKNTSKKVAVTVDSSIDFIKKICDNINPNYIQFHGNESLDYLENFKKIFPDISIIKAFGINNKNDFNKINQFNDVCDYYLFDSKVDDKFGGNGVKIDWNLFSKVKIDKNWFLSGGINADNIDQAIIKTKAQMVDISSGIEIAKGKKSPKLIKDILTKIKTLQYY